MRILVIAVVSLSAIAGCSGRSGSRDPSSESEAASPPPTSSPWSRTFTHCIGWRTAVDHTFPVYCEHGECVSHVACETARGLLVTDYENGQMTCGVVPDEGWSADSPGGELCVTVTCERMADPDSVPVVRPGDPMPRCY